MSQSHLPKIGLIPLACKLLVLAIVAFVVVGKVAAQAPDGLAIYQKKCASCHGKAGEGAKPYPHPLVGNRSVMQLSRYIMRFMPEDAPGTIKGPEADKVAAYIYDAFYSPAAQAKIKAPRIELARLTVNEYRYAIADLVGGFSTGKPVRSVKTGNEEYGLRGDYFTVGAKRNRTLAFTRLDPVLRFDFASTTSGFEKLKTPEIAANWHGSVIARETGLHEFIVRTEHSMKFWVNDTKKPLIDASVKSGNDTEFRAAVYMLAGRAYPIRLEFWRGNIGVRKDPKDKLKQVKTTVALEWKPPHGVAEVIPQQNLIPDDAPTAFAPAIALPPDDRSAGYERGTAVSKEWVQATTDGAIETANYVVAHLAELSGVRADAANRPTLLKDYAGKFAQRAFRRPLTTAEQKFYIDRQFEVAKDADAAVKRTVLLVLQSPRFLYREPYVAPGTNGDAFDVASRIAFSLWDSLPDAVLLSAAAEGRLKTRADVTREAERMLADRRAKTKVRNFFMQWLKADQVAEVHKDAKVFPGFDGRAVGDLQTSLEMFIDETIWSPASDYRQLFLAEHLFLNGRLAAFYGGDLPPDAKFQKVKLKTGDRFGVLTHPLLMANFSYTATSSPIHRGVFLARNVLGVALRQPPDAFTPLAPELHPNLSTRERIALQTSPKDCRSCHGIINSLGFTLENFDAIGRFRDQEKNKPIDASGFFVTRSGDKVELKNAQSLAIFVAESDEAHEAFVARMFHYLVRQPVLAYGPDKLTELRQTFATNQFNVRRLIVEIVAESALPDRKK